MHKCRNFIILFPDKFSRVPKSEWRTKEQLMPLQAQNNLLKFYKHNLCE